MASSCFVLLGLAILFISLSYHCIFNQQNGLVSVPLEQVCFTSNENDTRAALSFCFVFVQRKQTGTKGTDFFLTLNV